MRAASDQVRGGALQQVLSSVLSFRGPDEVGYGSRGAHGALRLESCAMVQVRCFDAFRGWGLRCNMALVGRQGVESPVLTIWPFFCTSIPNSGAPAVRQSPVYASRDGD